MNSRVMMMFRSNRSTTQKRHEKKHFADILDVSSGTVKTTDSDLDCSDHSIKSSNSNSCCQLHEHCVPVPEEETEPTQEKKKKKKSVRFSTVNIREYHICLGDNPSVARGAPISLDWHYEEEISIDLNVYEQHTIKREHNEEFKRPSLERLHLLKDIGYSRLEILEATRQVEKIRHQRFQTRRHLQRMDTFRSFFFFWKKNTTESKKESTSSTIAVVAIKPTLLHRDSLNLSTTKKKQKALITSVAQH